MNKRILQISLILAPFYIIAALITNGSHAAYFAWEFIMAAFCALAAFGAYKATSSTSDNEQAFSGVLGICVLCLETIYYFAHAVARVDVDISMLITVDRLCNTCAYLFFLDALCGAVIPETDAKNPLKLALNIITGLLAAIVFLTVLFNNEEILFLSEAAHSILCLVITLYAVKHASSKPFAFALMFFCAVELCYKALIVIDAPWQLFLAPVALYPFCYALLGHGLSRLEAD